MEYRMKDIMEPPKTLEEQKKEAREAAMAAGAEVLGEEWKPGTLENVKRLAGRNGALNDKQRSGGRICK